MQVKDALFEFTRVKLIKFYEIKKKYPLNIKSARFTVSVKYWNAIKIIIGIIFDI